MSEIEITVKDKKKHVKLDKILELLESIDYKLERLCNELCESESDDESETSDESDNEVCQDCKCLDCPLKQYN